MCFNFKYFSSHANLKIKFKVLEFAMATTQKDQHEIDAAMDNIRGQLNKLRSEIKAAPALESLKETQVKFYDQN